MSLTKLFRLEIPNYTPVFEEDLPDIRIALLKGIIWKACRASGVREASVKKVLQEAGRWTIGDRRLWEGSEVHDMLLGFFIEGYIEMAEDSPDGDMMIRECGEVI